MARQKSLGPIGGEPNWIHLPKGTQIVVRDDNAVLGNLVETIGAGIVGYSTAVHYIIDASGTVGGNAFTWNIYARLLGQRVKKATGTFTLGAISGGGKTIDATWYGQAVDAWELGIVKTQLGGAIGSFAFTVAGIAYGREAAA